MCHEFVCGNIKYRRGRTRGRGDLCVVICHGRVHIFRDYSDKGCYIKDFGPQPSMVILKLVSRCYGKFRKYLNYILAQYFILTES